VSSRSLAIKVSKHSSEPLTTEDVAIMRADFFSRFNQSIPDPLMISFRVKMLKERGDRFSKRLLTEKNHSIETLFLE
jgi:hypothetical protein